MILTEEGRIRIRSIALAAIMGTIFVANGAQTSKEA